MIQNLPEQLSGIFALALAVSAVSMTITKAKVTRPLRNRIKRQSEWFGELFSCPYCFSHWASFAAVAAVRPVLTSSGLLLLDLLISAFAVVALAAMASGLIYRSLSMMEMKTHP